jgi:hypothetical protein
MSVVGKFPDMKKTAVENQLFTLSQVRPPVGKWR